VLRVPKIRSRAHARATAESRQRSDDAEDDHSREYVPLLAVGTRVRAGADLGTRSTFADLGQTLADIFDVGRLAHGRAF